MARSRRKNATTDPGEPRPDPEVPEAAAEGAPPPSAPLEPAAPPAPVPPAPRAFGEPGPNERVYAVVFSRVWLAALGAASAMRRWTTTATDPVRGEIQAEARGLFGKRARPVRITVVLDDLGLTRLDATFLDESGRRAESVEPGQVARFHRQVESLLRRDSRA